MPSSFTWLDYSEHERRKMLDVIDLFGEKTTRDELGLGGVRDAFADLLFPGTTTIQTVAKYFLFVPWMYMDLERKQVPSSKVAERARKFEILYWDTDGIAIWMKRLEESRYQRPVQSADGTHAIITYAELQCILSGVDLSSVRQCKRYIPPPTSQT